MKKIIRLTEGDLHRIIENSVKKILKENRRRNRMISEAGHIYHKDEDGNDWANPTYLYRGVPTAIFFWNGNLPEIFWKGSELNAEDVEDSLWQSYEDECRENGDEPTEDGFEDWVEQQGTDYIASTLDEVAMAMNQ